MQLYGLVNSTPTQKISVEAVEESFLLTSPASLIFAQMVKVAFTDVMGNASLMFALS